MDLPGRVKWSWGFLGDESLEFARHTREYLESRIASCGSIFLGRIVNKPTVFVTSNTGAQELLQGEGLIDSGDVLVFPLGHTVHVCIA